MTAVIALLCLSVGGAFAWDFSKIEPTTTVFVDGVGETAQDRLLAFSQCSDKALERGEYETKQEFEKRKSNSQTDCDSLRRVKSYLESKVSLKYNADDFYFTFPVAEGDLVIPKRRFKHGRILIDYDFFDKTCPPSSDYRIPRNSGIFTGSIAKHLSIPGFTRKYDCPSFHMKVDKNFFAGGRIRLPVEIMYGDKKCTCMSKSWGSCNKKSCGKQPKKGPSYHPVSFTLVMDASIERARALKAMEDNLRLRLEGEFISWGNKKGYFFEMQRVVLVNQENDTVLFSVSGGG